MLTLNLNPNPIFIKLNLKIAVQMLRLIRICVGTVENHGKKWQKTRHTFVKMAKITAVYIADNLAKN